MIKSISQEYASLGPRRSIATLVPSFLIAQSAVLLGVPVSFNEIIVSAIVGSGLAVAGGAGVSPKAGTHRRRLDRVIRARVRARLRIDAFPGTLGLQADAFSPSSHRQFRSDPDQVTGCRRARVDLRKQSPDHRSIAAQRPRTAPREYRRCGGRRR